ncbi:MAG: hypothetical protein ABIO79_12575 [Ferruginibacter sp.]
MKLFFTAIMLLTINAGRAQELFVFTEPASNMAAKSIGIRLNNYLMKDNSTNKINYHLLPELMWGVSKNIMAHAEAFLSNRDNRFVYEGAGVYMKYRFYSVDEVHNHFRIAVFGRYSFNNSDIHQEAIDLNGHNSGYEGGLVATKLIKKVAFSSSISALHATDNVKEKFIYGDKKRNAVNYTLSVGKLMLPKDYTNYNQTNVNLMVEMLGQTNVNSAHSFLDVAPSIQFIFLSRMRLDAAYRIPLVTNLSRTAPGGFFLRLEYNIFNAY